MTKTDKLIREAEEKCEWFREQGERFEQIEDEMTGDEPEREDIPYAVMIARRDAERQKAIVQCIQTVRAIPSVPPPPPRPGGKAIELAEELAARDRAFAKLAKELEERDREIARLKAELEYSTEQLREIREPPLKAELVDRDTIPKKDVDTRLVSGETDNMKKPKDKVMIKFLRSYQGRAAGKECEVTPELARSWCDVPAPPARRI